MSLPESERPGLRPGFRITEVHIFAAIGDDGEEGIIGMTTPGGIFMPFVCADATRVADMRPHAIQIGKATNRTINLIRLSVREDVETFEP